MTDHVRWVRPEHDGILVGSRQGPGMILRARTVDLVAADGVRTTVDVDPRGSMGLWPMAHFVPTPTVARAWDVVGGLSGQSIDTSAIPARRLHVTWQTHDRFTGRFDHPWWDSAPSPQDLGVIAGPRPPRWWVHAWRGLQDGLARSGRLELLVGRRWVVLAELERCRLRAPYAAGFRLARAVADRSR